MGNCRSTVIPPLINPVTNDIVVNESDKANVLNNYFCSISSTANNMDPPNFCLSNHVYSCIHLLYYVTCCHFLIYGYNIIV